MAGFPFATAAAVHIFDLVPRDPEGKLGEITLARFRDLVHDRFLTTRIPDAEAMGTEETYTWGWAWPDDKNPVSVGPWLLFHIRAFTKKAPTGLVRAMYDKRMAEEKANQNPKQKLNAEDRAAIMDGIKRELTAQMPPNVEDHAVLLDTREKRLVLFNPSPVARRGFLSRLERILEPMLGSYTTRPWNLEHFIRLTRPKATLPPDLGSLFLTWIATQALHQRWCATVLDGETMRIQVELEDRLDVETETGSSKFDGEKIVQQNMEEIEADNNARVTQLRLHILARHGGDDARRYNAILDSEGAMPRLKLLSASKVKRSEDNLETATLDRGDDYLAVAGFIRVLMHAFNTGPLAERLAASPQTQLWPGAPTGDLSWFESDLVDWDTTPEPADPDQAGLFDGPEQAKDAKDDTAKRIAALNNKAETQALDRAKQMGYEHGTAGVKENPWPEDKAEHGAYEDGFETATVHKTHDKKLAKKARQDRTDTCLGTKKDGEPCSAKAVRQGYCMSHLKQGMEAST